MKMHASSTKVTLCFMTAKNIGRVVASKPWIGINLWNYPNVVLGSILPNTKNDIMWILDPDFRYLRPWDNCPNLNKQIRLINMYNI